MKKAENTVTFDRHEIVSKLYDVIDPELGVNIVDLGLLYNIQFEEGKVAVEFTATTPGCPMRRFLQQQVEEAVASVEGVTDYEVCLVWEPTWSVDMIDGDVEFFAQPPPQL